MSLWQSFPSENLVICHFRNQIHNNSLLFFLLLDSASTDPRLNAQLEELVWKPDSITDEEVDMFCLLVRAVGTLGRAYDPNSATRQPVLLGAAAAAGRDITKQHAHDLLHKANYDLRKAISLLLPGELLMSCLFVFVSRLRVPPEDYALVWWRFLLLV